IWWYARKHKIGFWHLNDAAAPALMLAYSVGRIGCQVAGDGDWGIPTGRPNPISWLPDWMWGYTYPNNVAGEGVRIPGCTDDKFCFQLAEPHFPTPFYETVICFMLFLILWSVRKRLKIPGTLFALYLMLNGVERFFIEKIRVNIKIQVVGFQFTQAELISFLLFISGLALWFYLRKRNTIVAS
ncbi:MAG TPA: prolipoprotein diacylglyceryl transferase family protein, partial [Flavitalea sp.]|nr:prolipoprotein diacylglyceryl transferase family protein [Flavitalea sp.]